MNKWTQASILEEIVYLYQSGQDMSHNAVTRENAALVRAAMRSFGSWRVAITVAGFDYDEVCRYKKWTRARILSRIQELHQQGVDLSYRNISSHVDPALAAAARRKHFSSWGEALQAAGLDYAEISRYRRWDCDTIKECLRELHEQGIALNPRHMEHYDIALITAARRCFRSWEKALEAAGVDARGVFLRKPYQRRRRVEVTASRSEATRSLSQVS